MPKIIRGYSREGRRVSAAVFIPLWVLFLVLAAVYDGGRDAIAMMSAMLLISLLLLTRFWRAVYPLMFALLGAVCIYMSVRLSSWTALGMGVLSILAAIGVAQQHRRPTDH